MDTLYRRSFQANTSTGCGHIKTPKQQLGDLSAVYVSSKYKQLSPRRQVSPGLQDKTPVLEELEEILRHFPPCHASFSACNSFAGAEIALPLFLKSSGFKNSSPVITKLIKRP